MARRPPLTVMQILEWADAHHARTGEWPGVASGGVFDAPREKWSRINTNLHLGLRGLPGGWSLAQLLDEFRGKRNLQDLPAYTIEQILAWADEHHARTGEWPTISSEQVFGAPGETWSAIHAALDAGRRGLPGGMSLAKLLWKARRVRRRRPSRAAASRVVAAFVIQEDTRAKKGLAEAMRRGVALRRRGRNTQRLPPFTVDRILAWADEHFATHGEWPKDSDGLIESTGGETWMAVSMALSQGGRGLPGGYSLARLLAEHRGVRRGPARPRLSVELVLAWTDAHRERTGAWPTVSSGQVAEDPQESWHLIDANLRSGGRGLPAGLSLPRLLDLHRGTRRAQDPPPLTIKRVLVWADAFHARCGSWPTTVSGAISESSGDTWGAIESALRHGLRGLPGGSSLAKLLAERRGKRNRLALPPLDVRQILIWADAFFARHGKWPGIKSGAIEDAPGESWQAINASLRDGCRGLPGGDSLPRLLDRCRHVRQRAQGAATCAGLHAR